LALNVAPWKQPFLAKASANSFSLRRCLSSKAPEEEKIVTAVNDDTPNMIFYGLYSTVCYSAVYVGTLSMCYMALTNGVISAETFDIDQIESAAKMQEVMDATVNLAEGPQFQHLADASMVNRYLKVPRVFMTTGVALVMAKTFGMDLEEDENGHKKIFMSLFALTLMEMDI
jgi:hypothetical protein